MGLIEIDEYGTHRSCDTSMKIRAANPEDLPAILQLDQQGFSEALPPFVIRQFYDLAGPLCLIAEDAEPIGYILGAKDYSGERGWVISTAVAEAWRNQGVARGLALALFDAMSEHGITEVFFTIKPMNSPMRKVANIMGAEELSFDENYFGVGEGRILLRKAFS
jgi:ribosomal-protein-alanine N-acetyltransferase